MMILPKRNPEKHDGQRGYPLCPGKAAGGESGGFHLGLADGGRAVGTRMVRAERFELPTFWFVARRSIQLSYARMRTRIDYQTGSKTPSSAAPHGLVLHPR